MCQCGYSGIYEKAQISAPSHHKRIVGTDERVEKKVGYQNRLADACTRTDCMDSRPARDTACTVQKSITVRWEIPTADKAGRAEDDNGCVVECGG